MKRRNHCSNPIVCWSSFRVVQGLLMRFLTVSNFAVSGRIPVCDTIEPSTLAWVESMTHFFVRNCMFAVASCWKMRLSMWMWLSGSGCEVFTTMSSRYGTIVVHKNSWKRVSITRWKHAGPFFTPKGSRVHSKSPHGV